MYLEKVIIFLKDDNNTKNYFKLDAISGAIQVTGNRHEASLFTLTTTPELHRTGQFQIVFSPSVAAENATAESLTHDALVMEDDITKEHLSQYGPYRLVSKTEFNPFAFEIHGVSTTLPEFGS